MRVILIFFCLSIFKFSFTQDVNTVLPELTADTIKNGKDFTIYKDGKIIQKEFYSSKNYIKIIYQYDKCGILIRRIWYNKEGKQLSVSLDN